MAESAQFGFLEATDGEMAGVSLSELQAVQTDFIKAVLQSEANHISGVGLARLGSGYALRLNSLEPLECSEQEREVLMPLGLFQGVPVLLYVIRYNQSSKRGT